MKKDRNVTERQAQSTFDTCPNCWGRQEYEGRYIKAKGPDHICSKKKVEQVGWIVNFANKFRS